MSEPEIEQLPLIDESVIAELQDVMGEDFSELIHSFLDDVPVQFELLQAAVAQADADQLYRAAHRLKSSCGTVGALRLAELVRRLEHAGRQQALAGSAELLGRARAVAKETVAGLESRLS